MSVRRRALTMWVKHVSIALIGDIMIGAGIAGFMLTGVSLPTGYGLSTEAASVISAVALVVGPIIGYAMWTYYRFCVDRINDEDEHIMRTLRSNNSDWDCDCEE